MNVMAPTAPRRQRHDDSGPADKQGRTLVIGLGNPIVTDDSVGIRVAELLQQLVGDREDVQVTSDCWGGLRLMERMTGFQRAIVIDAAVTGKAPGQISVCACGDARTQHSRSAHDVDVATALEFGRRAGAQLPAAEAVTFVAIEALDITTFGETCTPDVSRAIPHAARVVQRLLAEPLGRE